MNSDKTFSSPIPISNIRENNKSWDKTTGFTSPSQCNAPIGSYLHINDSMNASPLKNFVLSTHIPMDKGLTLRPLYPS